MNQVATKPVSTGNSDYNINLFSIGGYLAHMALLYLIGLLKVLVDK